LQLDDSVLLASTPGTATVGLGQSGPVDLVAQRENEGEVIQVKVVV
jgi:hypothetical protein